MKKIALLAAMASTMASLFAFPGHGAGISPQDILAAAPSAANKTPDQVTMEERLAMASAFSLERQKASYVRRAAGASFVMPGAGQLMIGDYGSAALHIAAQAAIVGGSLAAMWYLSPDDLRDSSMTRDERRKAIHAYFEPDRIGEILPAMGVAAGGIALSIVNSVIASNGARSAAEDNIRSGRVTFEPSFAMMGRGLGMGMTLRLR
jgi:hypothetical protein